LTLLDDDVALGRFHVEIIKKGVLASQFRGIARVRVAPGGITISTPSERASNSAGVFPVFTISSRKRVRAGTPINRVLTAPSLNSMRATGMSSCAWTWPSVLHASSGATRPWSIQVLSKRRRIINPFLVA